MSSTWTKPKRQPSNSLDIPDDPISYDRVPLDIPYSKMTEDEYLKSFHDDKEMYIREVRIWEEETNIWSDILDRCQDKYHVNAAKECKYIIDILKERKIYERSKYLKEFEPKLSPPLMFTGRSD